MNLENLKSAFATQGCQKLYVKKLAANDSSKNQVYLGGSFDILNIFPVSEVYADSSGDWERDRFKADVNFYWLTEGGNLSPAPKAQFIIYPKYPEVRFSGFLAGSENPPSELMTQRLPGRLLFLSPNKEGRIIGYVSSPDSQLAQEFDHLAETQSYGVFSVIELASIANNRQNLIAELTRIHYLGWIHSKRLNSAGEILPCLAPQCVGYTLEAELGVRPNSYSEPDFLGWEIKAFGVKKFEKFAGSVITLFTPEPNGGFYGIHGLSAFVRKYGYCDLRGREDRINFGGIYKVENTHPRTKLRLEIVGFDHVSGKISDSNGKITLIDQDDNEAATWSFAALLKKWNAKHNQACYVPAKSAQNPSKQYHYGNQIILGIGTDFQLFLQEMSEGHIYYDPGIKIENASTANPRPKGRSQFRIKSGFLPNLYRKSEQVNLSE